MNKLLYKYSLILLLFLGNVSSIMANDSLQKASVKGFIDFIVKNQKQVAEGKKGNYLYQFNGLIPQAEKYLADSAYINGGQQNQFFTNRNDVNYKNAWALINKINDHNTEAYDKGNFFVYVFYGRYFFNRDSIYFDAKDWDSFIKSSQIDNKTKQEKKTSRSITNAVYSDLFGRFPTKKIAIVYIIEEFTASPKTADSPTLYASSNTVLGSATSNRVYYKDFKIMWQYFGLNALEKGLLAQKRTVSALPVNASGSASDADYSKAFFETVNNKVNALKEVKTVGYPNFPMRERLYAHLLSKNAFDPSFISGFEELKPNGFMYNYIAGYNINVENQKRGSISPDLKKIYNDYLCDISFDYGKWVHEIFEDEPSAGADETELLVMYIKRANNAHLLVQHITDMLDFYLVVIAELDKKDRTKAKALAEKRQKFIKLVLNSSPVGDYMPILQEELHKKLAKELDFLVENGLITHQKALIGVPALVIAKMKTTVNTIPKPAPPTNQFSGRLGGLVVIGIFAAIEMWDGYLLVTNAANFQQEFWQLRKSLENIADIVDFDKINATLETLTPEQINFGNLLDKLNRVGNLTDDEWIIYKDLACKLLGECYSISDWKTYWIKGIYSKRNYCSIFAGGQIMNLDWRNATVNQQDIEIIEKHLMRFGPINQNAKAIQRLKDILAGRIVITDFDKRFLTHELDEYARFKALKIPDDVFDGRYYNHAHTGSLEDYKIDEKTQDIYHPSTENSVAEEIAEDRILDKWKKEAILNKKYIE